jgi:hypothetical protein
MIRKKPALGFGPRVEAGSSKRSCSTKILARQSIQLVAIALYDSFAAAAALSLAVCEAGADFGPPFDTPTIAGRKTRSPIM